MNALHRRLDRIDGGGDGRNAENMTDAQLARGLTPSQLSTFETGAAVEVDALLQAIIAGSDACTG
jgi:hypothetical protein